MTCGMHCVNALLQGPFFDEVSMSEVANSLNQQEQSLLDPTDNY